MMIDDIDLGVDLSSPLTEVRLWVSNEQVTRMIDSPTFQWANSTKGSFSPYQRQIGADIAVDPARQDGDSLPDEAVKRPARRRGGVKKRNLPAHGREDRDASLRLGHFQGAPARRVWPKPAEAPGTASDAPRLYIRGLGLLGRSGAGLGEDRAPPRGKGTRQLAITHGPLPVTDGTGEGLAVEPAKITNRDGQGLFLWKRSSPGRRADSPRLRAKATVPNSSSSRRRRKSPRRSTGKSLRQAMSRRTKDLSLEVPHAFVPDKCPAARILAALQPDLIAVVNGRSPRVEHLEEEGQPHTISPRRP